MTAQPTEADAPLRGDLRRPRARGSWRDGGPSVGGWDLSLLGWSMLSVACALLLIAAARSTLTGDAASVVSGLALGAGLLVPVAVALTRSRPRGLLGIRPVDALYAVVLGTALRLAQGSLSRVGSGADAPFPSFSTFDGALPPGWWFGDGILAVLVMPTLEEVFFRGVLLVTVYTLARKAMGRGGAGIVALITTSAAFVALHAIGGILAWDTVASLSLVGLVCGLLVLLTGRIWAAVLTHAVYNGTWLLLTLAGTLLA